MTRQRDVIILGAGLAGLSAAYDLRDLDFEVLEAADYIGGRTKSVKLPNGPWINYGAQYITEDRPKVVELADAVGVELLPSENFDEYWKRLLPATPGPRAEAEAAIERIEAEQQKPRPATLTELDEQSFADWLGPMSTGAAAYFEAVCELMNCASSVELSLYGGLWIWGEQRSTPWSTDEIPRHSRGEVIVSGGTSELAKAVSRAIGGRVSLRTRVLRVTEEPAGYAVEALEERGRRVLRARRVVCALPAPVVVDVIAELPGWKRAALQAVRYGRWISTPIVVGPRDAPPTNYPLVASRPTIRYNIDDFMARTPGDIDELGGCFHSFMSNAAARQVWDDPDDSIKSGAVRIFLDRFPEYRDRIVRVDLQRWEHGLPQYRRGLMRHFPALAAPVGNIHFCGDYTWQANTEGATRSGQRAAAQLRGGLSTARSSS
jgi:monoamine oxidase